jgi:hypothetical protein
MNQFIQETSCENCPFNETGPGRRLRDILAPGRFDSIKADLDNRKTFNCHKTTKETGDGTEKVCAGALAYQRKNHCVPDSVQVVERIIAMKEGKKARW